jgi:hypothetical protein
MKKTIYTRNDILKALKELQAEGKQPGRSGLNEKGISAYWVGKLIPEGLTEFKAANGLKVSAQEKPRQDEELLTILDSVVRKHKRMPSWQQLRNTTGIADKTFINRFGHNQKEVYKKYREWLKKKNVKSKNLKYVDDYLKGRDVVEKGQVPAVTKKRGTVRHWPKSTGRECGPALNFGNMIYAPINEQGVVFLFGMMSKHLGFAIECIDTAFPDCEAKRTIKGGRQQHVKIEFEFRSRDYDHPLAGCDIIVCWEHNWKECPLEVIELSKEIETLREATEFKKKLTSLI